ncbi:MAG TPA: serine/threonine-protein kinase [Pirellulales bacterium]|nr:serine/threonine-protein kinase [Pirellulales bacterium]
MTETRNCPECGAELPADSPSGLCPRCLLKQGFESHAAEKLAETAAPGSRFTAPPPAELARHFPQLEVLELLGQGGMGAVYKARQATLDRLVALKILPAEVGRDPAFAERFAREARALARLNHPNIVGIYDFGQVDGLYHFVMEYVDGVSLRQLVEGRQLAPSQALALVPQICEALQFAHDEGIVHRDVKPENILLDKRGRVKIADFGLAKLLGLSAHGATLTRIEQVMGTPLYMAPEQMQASHAVDHRADIYSLGVVFYEMLTGELPLGRFAPPSHKVQVDVRLDEVVLRTLEREPDRRYQHASDVKTEVESIVASPAATAASATGAAHTTPAQCPAQVRAPAIGLLIAGIFNWVWMPLAGGAIAYAFAASPRTHLSNAEGALLALAALTILTLSGCIMIAALKMMRCQAYPLAILGSVLAMLVSPGNLIGLPIGIWALVILTQRDVKRSFSRVATRHPSCGKRIVRAPSACLLIVAGISLVTALGIAIWFGPAKLFCALLTLHALFLASAATVMRRLRARRYALFAMILAGGVLPLAVGLPPLALWPAWIPLWLGMPATLWAMATLFRPEVREAFASTSRNGPAQAEVAAHGNVKREADRLSVPWLRCANTHAWVVVLGLLGVASGLLPWGRLSWYGPNTSGALDAPSRWNTQALYGWGSWEGKAIMAVFLVLALFRLASGFASRPKRWQAASLIVGAACVLTLCYLSTQDRITPQLPILVLNLVHVELQPGLAVPVALAVALLIVAAVELRVVREVGGQALPFAALFASLIRSRLVLRALQWLLSLMAVACFLMFFNFHSEGHHDSQGNWQSSWAVGSPTPWFLYETWPAANTPFRWNFMLNSSWFFTLLAFAACYAAWRIEKVLRPQAGFWSGSPQMILLGWWLAVMFITGYTIWMGNRSLGWSIPAAQTTGGAPAAEPGR